MALIVEALNKRFGRFPALNDVSFQAEDGEFLALLGPSGSGKTTLLRVLAGLEQPDSGRVMVQGRDHLALSARERRVGMVFQHYALFRHMTAAQNVAFGLTVRPRRDRPPKAEIKQRVQALLDQVRLGDLGHRRPAQLSGGQRQRVALARALAVEPKLLLLDEPFGALDAKVREELRIQLRAVHDATAVTTLFVTHDQEEAMSLADKVVVMNAGRVEQVGSPTELEQAPASAFVFEFLGECNRLACEVEDGVARIAGASAPVIGASLRQGPATALFRRHDLVLEDAETGQGVPVEVLHARERGALRTLDCRTAAGETLTAELSAADTRPTPAGATFKLRPTRVYAA